MAIEPKSYPLEGKLEGISDKSLQEHRDVLYKGYVTQYNTIQTALTTADRSKANPHFSEFGELKRRETWAHNGTILHEMYFENLGGKGTTPGPKTKAIIDRDWGSLDKFKEELLACGKVAPVGWSVWAYSFLDQKTHIYVIEQHQNHTPIMVIPLLILDEFEHAYFTDYGTKRPDYLNAFWTNLNWDAVEKRVTQWLAMTGALATRRRHEPPPREGAYSFGGVQAVSATSPCSNPKKIAACLSMNACPSLLARSIRYVLMSFTESLTQMSHASCETSS